ncbi:MAG: putative glycoside hydrolase [Elusimicrobia bacterium]|nr:putative glycoside hydrolase [Candidatus Obscuribacterium magneticum]
MVLRVVFLTFSLCLSIVSIGCTQQSGESNNVKKSTAPLWGDYPNERPSCIKGIHLTSWVTGNSKRRAEFETLLAETELNTVVIDIKEIEGTVFIPGIKLDNKIDVYEGAIRDIKSYLSYLKERGIFTLARIVVFNDQMLTKNKPEWAVHTATPMPKAVQMGFDPDVWVDKTGKAWADPYNPWVWKYNIDIAVQAAHLGFQGIQFDYIRFPSDGDVKNCVYSKPHSMASSVNALTMFLTRAGERLKPLNVEISIDVFGLAGSFEDDLGIGQRLVNLTEKVDVVSPMMYPSHYRPWEYGIRDPNSSPYQTVRRSISDTRKAIKGVSVLLRPYFQDFSLGVKYSPRHVRDQIEAAAEQGVNEWLLWNPGCRYTKEALMPFAEKLGKSNIVNQKPDK